jgi:hypothetical protein
VTIPSKQLASHFGGTWRACLRSLAIAVTVAACATPAPSSPDRRVALAVFSDPGPQSESEFTRLSLADQLPVAQHVPGVLSVQSYLTIKADTPVSTLPRHLALYQLEPATLAASADALARQSPPGAQLKTVAYRAWRGLIDARAIEGSSRPTAIAGKTVLGKYSLMVLSNATSGRESEYDVWYDGQHVPDVLRIPGFISAQRYIILDANSTGTAIPRYMVMFDFDSYDLEETIVDLKLRNRTGITKMSPSFNTEGVQVYYYRRK